MSMWLGSQNSYLSVLSRVPGWGHTSIPTTGTWEMDRRVRLFPTHLQYFLLTNVPHELQDCSKHRKQQMRKASDSCTGLKKEQSVG